MRKDNTARAAERAREYAQAHPQPVRVVWVDRRWDLMGADQAAALCADRRVSGRVIAAVARDQRLEGLLNGLLDLE